MTSKNEYTFSCSTTYPNGFIVRVGEDFNVNCNGRISNNPKKLDKYDLAIIIYYTFPNEDAKKQYRDCGALIGPFD